MPNRRPLRLALTAALILLAGSSIALTDQPGRDKEPGEPRTALNVEFRGGTVAEYVQVLRNSADGLSVEIYRSPSEPPVTVPVRVNVALRDSVASVRLAPITLRDVSVGTAVAAIQYAAEVPLGQEIYLNTIQDPTNTPSWVASPAFAVGLNGVPFSGASDGTPDQRRLEVFSLKDLTAGADSGIGLSVDTVLSAVEQALALSGGDRPLPPEVKFHTESNLLLIYALPDEISAIHALMERLTRDVQKNASHADDTQQEMVEREFNLRVAAVQMEAALRNLEAYRTEQERIRSLHEAGAVSDGELHSITMRVRDAEDQVAMSEAQVSKAQALARLAEGQGRVPIDSSQFQGIQARLSKIAEQLEILTKRVDKLERR